MQDLDRKTEEYLARIRKTISESESLVSQAQLRMQETDRLLEAQGLTREQVMALRFTPDQKLAVNEELRRRGLPPMEDDTSEPDFEIPQGAGIAAAPNFAIRDSQGDLENRQKKFGMMMKPFSI